MEERMNLKSIRNEIDETDTELVRLLEKRLNIVENVAKYKIENNMEVFDGKRENEVIKKNLLLVKNDVYKPYVENFFKDIMSNSSSYQRKLIKKNESLKKTEVENVNVLIKENDTVGYTGIPGSYAYEVLDLFKHNIEITGSKNINIKEKNYSSHKELIEAVARNEIDFAVVPIENSLTGEVRDSVDLINKSNVYIVAEIKHKINHSLLGIQDSKIEEIENIYSHEQPLMQCSHFLNENPKWGKRALANTALAAKHILDIGDKTNACIASKNMIDLYNLKILKSNIADMKENYTRFILITNKMLNKDDNNKVSIITSTENKPGELLKLLGIFSDESINMINLMSRPIVNKPWEYYFYIDFEGNIKNENVKRVIEHLETNGKYFKLLGNYKEYSDSSA